MKYLGIDPQKVRVGVFDFTGCEGCELQLANKEDSLLDFLSLLEVVNFREVSSDRGHDYDVALIEGNISRADEIDRLKDIRAKAKVLVKQHLDGAWTVRWKDQVIATHAATPINEPVRSWKKREKVGPVRGRSMMQVYISSKPAPLP